MFIIYRMNFCPFLRKEVSPTPKAKLIASHLEKGSNNIKEFHWINVMSYANLLNKKFGFNFNLNTN
jgi:hypothetical protein